MAQELRVKPQQGKVVVVAVLPECDFCGTTARYDFRTWQGPWANGCSKHYQEHRASTELGVGKAQMLIVETEAAR